MYNCRLLKPQEEERNTRTTVHYREDKSIYIDLVCQVWERWILRWSENRSPIVDELMSAPRVLLVPSIEFTENSQFGVLTDVNNRKILTNERIAENEFFIQTQRYLIDHFSFQKFRIWAKARKPTLKIRTPQILSICIYW